MSFNLVVGTVTYIVQSGKKLGTGQSPRHCLPPSTESVWPALGDAQKLNMLGVKVSVHWIS